MRRAFKIACDLVDEGQISPRPMALAAIAAGRTPATAEAIQPLRFWNSQAAMPTLANAPTLQATTNDSQPRTKLQPRRRMSR